MTNSNRQPLPDEQPGLVTLILALLVALAVAAVLIVTVVLPAEKGIDPTGIGAKLHLTRMGVIKTELAKPDAPVVERPSRIDEITLTLEPGQGAEIKLDMEKGYTATYQWVATGGSVHHDTHGDPFEHPSVYISYSKADSVSTEEGTLRAIYGGYHGWYWKNNNDKAVSITLKTRGEYKDILRY